MSMQTELIAANYSLSREMNRMAVVLKSHRPQLWNAEMLIEHYGETGNKNGWKAVKALVREKLGHLVADKLKDRRTARLHVSQVDNLDMILEREARGGS